MSGLEALLRLGFTLTVLYAGLVGVMLLLGMIFSGG